VPGNPSTEAVLQANNYSGIIQFNYWKYPALPEMTGEGDSDKNSQEQHSATEKLSCKLSCKI